MATGKINPPRICPNGKGTGFDVRYNDEVIIQYDDKKIMLDSSGIRTSTIKKQMNNISDKFELGFRIYSKGGEWFVKDTTYILPGMIPSISITGQTPDDQLFVDKMVLNLPILNASYLVLRYNARNDKNGNPRRVYVVYKDSDIDTIYNEGYKGSNVVSHPHHWRALKKSGWTTNIDVSEYKEFLKMDAVEPESLKN